MLDRIEQEVPFLPQIIDCLKSVDPARVILIGSYSNNNFNDESDIDLVVILDDDQVPKSYDEKLNLKVQVRDSIYSISRQVPIDLVVYTKGEFSLLEGMGTSFYNEIQDTGKTVYEKAG